VNSGTTHLARVDQAFSGETAASGGLGPAVNSPITGSLVQPAVSGTVNATARGTGAEVGLGVSNAQQNQIQLGIAESEAPPPNSVGTITGPAVSAVPLVIPGVLQTGVLHGFAATSYSPTFCPVGQPLAFGLGSAAAPTTVATTLVASPGDAQSFTRTDLVANSDGTFGLATQVAETIAPVIVTLAGAGTATPTTLEINVQGTSPSQPIVLTSATDGEGHAATTLSNGDPSVEVILTLAGVALPPITASLATLGTAVNGLLGPTSGLHTLLSGLGLDLALTIGDGKTVASPLPGDANGPNTTSGSYDLIGLHLGTTGTSPTTVLDLRIGHLESFASLPAGSIECTVPVAKVANPPTVTAGNTFTWAISIPATSSSLADSTCDLTNIKATDKISINSGSPSFNVGTISNGGVYNSATKTVTWSNLGTYHPGDPPIVVTIQVSVPSGSAAGVLQDTANVTAGLGNCTGGITGVATAIGPVQNAIIGGSVTLIAPRVNAGTGPGLAATGTGPMLAWIAAGLLAVAEGSRRLLRRARRTE
jgi:hypothetical protein